ncbi:hypothetical protein LZF95_04035 [Algoriphagus sp. AGSA1]|uniref:Spy/CpxP family protein refolding chaperone n=1 Tax=Algoriphagus sp. AGSA1 TaxID=2907213 RepID=UPI001F2AC18C|nr:hypothetical protein [Algoriphagus sp. AGSA1]MCE7053837.1 hypothetical protein [Algoriphagus sp. AGSA1]
MKKYSWIIFVFFLTIGTVLAQQPEGRYDREKLDAARVAFITTRLNLTPSQAEKFWPVYNVFEESRDKNLREMIALGKSKDTDLSESEAKSRISKKFDIQRKLVEDEEKFVENLSGILTYNQILQLNGLSREFARHIYQRRKEEQKK